jgi:perosamine synthetase
MYLEVVKDCEFFIPQKTFSDCRNTYWTFASRFTHPDVSWYHFRDKFVELGGESIFASWALTYDEPVIADENFKSHAPDIYRSLEFSHGICPQAEIIQPQLMQFITNYESKVEVMEQIDALQQAINYFS